VVDDFSGDTSGTYGGGDTYGSAATDDFSIGQSPSLSDEAMASIGSSQNQDQSFFGGPDYSVMDFGRGSVSNITNAANYDPNFAALGMIGRGLTPGFDLRNQIDFDVPTSMLPSLEGKYGPVGAKFYSPVERALVEMEPVGIMSMIGKGFQSIMDSAKSSFNDAKSALGLKGDAAGGLKDEDFTGMMGTRDDQQISDMSQTGAQMNVTDPVATTPNVAMGTIPQVSPTFDAFGNVTRDANMSRFADQFGQINAGIASVAPNMAQDANIQVADASQFLNPQAISRGLNYFAGPQIQDFFRGVTNNPNTTIRLGPGFDMNKREVDDNIFSINIPFATG